MIERNKMKEPPSRVTKDNRTEQEEKSKDERSELKTGPTITKKSSQQEKAGCTRTVKEGVMSIAARTIKRKIPSKLVLREMPPLNQTGEMGD